MIERGRFEMKVLLTFFCFLWPLQAGAGALDDFKERYATGTFRADDSDYAQLYALSEYREIEFAHVQYFDSRIDAYYTTRMYYDGKPYEQGGVASLYVEDDQVTRVEFVPATDKAKFDLALAGQAADVGTTAAALGLGLAEGNPAVAAAIASPAGAVALVGAKLGVAEFADTLGLYDCVAVRTAAGSVGWFAAAWNVGMVVAGPAAAVVLGVVALGTAFNKVAEDSPTRCIEAE